MKMKAVIEEVIVQPNKIQPIIGKIIILLTLLFLSLVHAYMYMYVYVYVHVYAYVCSIMHNIFMYK